MHTAELHDNWYSFTTHHTVPLQPRKRLQCVLLLDVNNVEAENHFHFFYLLRRSTAISRYLTS